VERARIAREMHDGVALHLTVIVALSDGALAAFTRAPTRAADAIRGSPAPPGRRSPTPAACSASCVPRAGWNSGSRSRACPTLTACSPGSGRRGCRSGTNAAARSGTPRPALAWGVERRNHVSSNSDFWYAQIDLFGAKLTASGQTAAGTHQAGIRALLQRGLITQGGKERPASWIRSLPNRCCPS